MVRTKRGLLFLPLLKDDVLAKICPDNGRKGDGFESGICLFIETDVYAHLA